MEDIKKHSGWVTFSLVVAVIALLCDLVWCVAMMLGYLFPQEKRFLGTMSGEGIIQFLFLTHRQDSAALRLKRIYPSLTDGIPLRFAFLRPVGPNGVF